MLNNMHTNMHTYINTYINALHKYLHIHKYILKNNQYIRVIDIKHMWFVNTCRKKMLYKIFQLSSYLIKK